MSDLAVTTLAPGRGARHATFRIPRGRTTGLTGRFQLAQQFLFVFLGTPGTDAIAPDFGAGFLRNLGQVYSEDSLRGAAMTASISADRQMAAQQAASKVHRAKEEILKFAALTDVQAVISVGLISSVAVSISLATAAGNPFSLTFNTSSIKG